MPDYQRLWEEAEERAGVATEWLDGLINVTELILTSVEKLYARLAEISPDFPSPAEPIQAARTFIARAKAETGLDKKVRV